MTDTQSIISSMSDELVPLPPSQLSAIQLQQLADVPAATTWFANIDNPQTRRAYRNNLNEFMHFVGFTDPAQFRMVTRAHVLAEVEHATDIEVLRHRAITMQQDNRLALPALKVMQAHAINLNELPQGRIIALDLPGAVLHECGHRSQCGAGCQ